MGLGRDIKRAFTLTPRQVATKLLLRVRRARGAGPARAADVSRCTYLPSGSGTPVDRLLRFDAPLDVPPVLGPLAERYLAHEFDLLGSGPVRVAYGIQAKGVEGHRYPAGPIVEADPEGEWLSSVVTQANRQRARELWRLVDPGYVPIDWQLDFKSGFRWDAATWFRDIAIGLTPGADVKVPWELARMQHLPQLALVSGAMWAEPEFAERCAREIRNQILDFAASNPPRFGVNWACTMDVAIRITNVLLAIDLLAAFGREFDGGFTTALADIVADHALFIADNLEDDVELRDNHYLADVCGWVFAAAYRNDAEALATAAGEVLAEVRLQFDERGVNFEGSTSYHRLTSEMVVWALAVMVRRGVEVPEDVVSRLPGMVRFALDCARPDGRAVQLGDNDDGRFVKPVPDVDTRTLVENPLRPDALVSAVAGLLGDAVTVPPAAAARLECRLVRELAGGELDVKGGSGREPVRAYGERIGPWVGRARAAARSVVSEYPLPADALRGLTTSGYPEFGAWFWRAEGLYLAVRCGPVGRRGQGSHDHNDQLGVELWIGGEPIHVDPGTYLYTASPERRDEYRSVRAHAAPRVEGREPGRLDLGLFQIVNAATGTCESFSPEGFAGHHDGYPTRLHRVIEVREDVVRITDWREDGGPLVSEPVPIAYSPGYGCREEAR